jgi:uncharacterized protein YndB with AHSA1/START domain
MLVKILLAVAAVLAVLIGVIVTRPPTFRVERSLLVAAPPDRVYGQIVDFHRWEGWSPWAKLDPQMKTTYQGRDGEVGASYAWLGDDKVGEGRMTITGLTPPRRVVVRLEFLKPWKATNETSFDLAEEPGGTRVAWIMKGENTFMGKAMSLFMDMDRMVGGDFEKGLAALKGLAEAAPR